MNRASNGVDRQRTNMYWPEEENSPSIHEYSPSRNGRPSSRASSSRTSSVSYDSFGDDVNNTREMVRKQQESKIQFYDYDNSVVPPSRTITPSSVAKNLSRESPEADPTDRKLQTLKSRIEFYDYVDEAPPAARYRGTSRGNASESETRSSSAAAAVNKAERDSNFVRETYAAAEDRTDGRTAKSGRTINHTPTANPNRSQKVENHKQSTVRPVPMKVEGQESDSNSNRRSPTASSSPGYKKQLSSSVIDLSTLDLDDPELEQLKKLKAMPSKNEIDKKLATFHTEIRVSNNNPKKSPVSANSGGKNSPPQVNLHADQYDDDDDRSVKRLTRNRRDPVSPTPSSCTEDAPNEARRMAHRHLQSSFAFGKEPARDTNGAGSLGRRSYSIRDTAVCRVGVGLPDL